MVQRGNRNVKQKRLIHVSQNGLFDVHQDVKRMKRARVRRPARNYSIVSLKVVQFFVEKEKRGRSLYDIFALFVRHDEIMPAE